MVLVLAGPKRLPLAPWLKDRLDAREAAKAQKAAEPAVAKEGADIGKPQSGALFDAQIAAPPKAQSAALCTAQVAVPSSGRCAAFCEDHIATPSSPQRTSLCEADVSRALVDQGGPCCNGHNPPPSKAQGAQFCNGHASPPSEAQDTAPWAAQDASPVQRLSALLTAQTASPFDCPDAALPDGYVKAAFRAWNKGLAEFDNAAFVTGNGGGSLESADAGAAATCTGNHKGSSTAQGASPRTVAEIVADLDMAIITRAAPGEKGKLLHELFGGDDPHGAGDVLVVPEVHGRLVAPPC
jgi:hypothetical protein